MKNQTFRAALALAAASLSLLTTGAYAQSSDGSSNDTFAQNPA